MTTLSLPLACRLSDERLLELAQLCKVLVEVRSNAILLADLEKLETLIELEEAFDSLLLWS